MGLHQRERDRENDWRIIFIISQRQRTGFFLPKRRERRGWGGGMKRGKWSFFIFDYPSKNRKFCHTHTQKLTRFNHRNCCFRIIALFLSPNLSPFSVSPYHFLHSCKPAFFIPSFWFKQSQLPQSVNQSVSNVILRKRSSFLAVGFEGMGGGGGREGWSGFSVKDLCVAFLVTSNKHTCTKRRVKTSVIWSESGILTAALFHAGNVGVVLWNKPWYQKWCMRCRPC